MIGVTLWVPGPWKDQSEFVKAIAGTDDGVVAAGGLMVDDATKQHAMFDLLPPDENLAREMFIGWAGRWIKQRSKPSRIISRSSQSSSLIPAKVSRIVSAFSPAPCALPAASP